MGRIFLHQLRQSIPGKNMQLVYDFLNYNRHAQFKAIKRFKVLVAQTFPILNSTQATRKISHSPPCLSDGHRGYGENF